MDDDNIHQAETNVVVHEEQAHEDMDDDPSEGEGYLGGPSDLHVPENLEPPGNQGDDVQGQSDSDPGYLAVRKIIQGVLNENLQLEVPNEEGSSLSANHLRQRIRDLREIVQNMEGDSRTNSEDLLRLLLGSGNLPSNNEGSFIKQSELYAPEIDSRTMIEMEDTYRDFSIGIFDQSFASYMAWLSRLKVMRGPTAKDYQILDDKIRVADLINTQIPDERCQIEAYFINISFPVFSISKEFPKFQRHLGLSPALLTQAHGREKHGVGRRLVAVPELGWVDQKGKQKESEQAKASRTYHLWFYLTLLSLNDEMPRKQNPRGNIRSNLEGVDLPNIGLSIVTDSKFFYLTYDFTAQKTTIVSANESRLRTDILKERVKDISQQPDVMYNHQDPFIFVCTALSEVYESWVYQSSFYFDQLKTTEARVVRSGKSLFVDSALEADASRDEQVQTLHDSRNLMMEFHELRSLQSHQLQDMMCFERSITECIDEHRKFSGMVDIQEDLFQRVEGNMKTLLSWTISSRVNLESAIKNTNNSLETLTNLINLRNSDTTQVNTQVMARVAEETKKENASMRDLAEATKQDSESMETIALLTMIYLPASFTATFFSMGIVQFNFQDSNPTSLSLSESWWVFPALAIPLTAITFFSFALRQRKQKLERVKAKSHIRES